MAVNLSFFIQICENYYTLSPLISTLTGFIISEGILGNSDITLKNYDIGNGRGYVD